MLKVNSLNSKQQGRAGQDEYQPVNLTFLLSGEPLENLARETLKMLHLYSQTEIDGYNRIFGGDILAHFISELKEVETLISDAKKKKKTSLSIVVYVAKSFIENINKYRANPNAPPIKSVTEMTTEEKVGEALRRSLLLMPADVAKQLANLITPQAIAIMVGVLVIWGGSHFFGVGEIVDVILLVLGGLMLGMSVFTAAEHLYSFGTKSVNAKTDQDLDVAAEHFAEAVAILGVQVVAAILLKKAPKVFKEPRVKMNQAVTPLSLKKLPPLPRTKGRLLYRPKTTGVKYGRPGEGVTTYYGDSFYSTLGPTKLVRATKIHERVHQILIPKLQVFREIQIIFKQNSYLKSYILRYLEEALAETVAQISVYGVRNALNGIKFPVKNGYVTVAKMRTEAKGILMGPINVGGMIYNVYFNITKPDIVVEQ